MYYKIQHFDIEPMLNIYIFLLSTDNAYYSSLQEIFDDDISKSPVDYTVISTIEKREFRYFDPIVFF